MAKTNNNSAARPKKRRSSGIPLSLMIVLLVIALVMGGLAGFAIARRTNPLRAQLLHANERIIALEERLGIGSGEDIPTDDVIGIPDGNLASDLAGGFDASDDTDLWQDDDLLSGTLNETGDPVVVAEFDGGELLSTEVIPEYNDQLTTLILSGFDAEDVSETVLNDVLRYMASEKIVAVRAQQQGLDKLTDEDLKAIEAEAKGEYEDQIEYYSVFVSEPGMTQDQIRARAAEESGITLESVTEQLKAEWPARKLYEEIVKDVTVIDQEVQQHYRELLETQKSNYSEYPDEYEYAHIDGELILYNPEGYRAVRDLLIPFEDEDSMDKAADLLDQIDQLDPTKDTEKIQALEAELAPLYAPLEEKAQEVITKLQAGESFDSLLAEYGRDEGMETEPVHSEGYYISDDSFLFSTEFIEGSMLLEQPGQVSSPLRSSAGIHLTEYTSDIPAGDVPLDVAYESVKAEALEQKKAGVYEQETAAMLDAANVKYYPERLQ